MLKIGIIGSGFGLYGLLPAFNSMKDCQVVAICGKKTDRLVNYCENIGLRNIYTDWQQMLNNEQLHAIAIAVPPSIQYQIAKAAIGKGLHIFAEKPLSATLHQAEEMLALAQTNDITHTVDFIFPEIDLWRKVKKFIDTSHFGKLKHISSHWDFLSYEVKNKIFSWKTNIAEGGGALSFYFSHVLYYLEYFAGEIFEIETILSYSAESLNGGETGVDALLKFKDNITGHAHLCCESKGPQYHQVTFYCEKGLIILENQNKITKNFTVKLYSEKGIEVLTDFQNDIEDKSEDERVNVVRKIASRFVEASLHHQSMTPSFKEGLRVQKLIEIIRAKQL